MIFTAGKAHNPLGECIKVDLKLLALVEVLLDQTKLVSIFFYFQL